MGLFRYSKNTFRVYTVFRSGFIRFDGGFMGIDFLLARVFVPGFFLPKIAVEVGARTIYVVATNSK